MSLLVLCFVSLVIVSCENATTKEVKSLLEEAKSIRYKEEVAAYKEIISALAMKGTPAVPALVKALSDESQIVGEVAGKALGRIGQPAVPALIEKLSDKEAQVRRYAAFALGEVGEPAKEAGPVLMKLLADKDEYVRSEAARALGNIGESSATSELIQKLKEKSPRVRAKSAEARGKFGNPRAVPALIDALNDEDATVRKETAKALGEIGEPAAEAIPALIERVYIGRSTKKVKKYLYPHTKTYYKWEEVAVNVYNEKSAEVRAASAYALGKIGVHTKDVEEVLVRALLDGNSEVLANVAVALAEIGSGKAAWVLTSCMCVGKYGWIKSSVSVRTAADALVMMGPKAVPALVNFYAGEPSARLDYVQARIISVLGGIGDPAVPGLIELLAYRKRSPNTNLFVEAFKEIGAPAVPALIEALDDRERAAFAAAIFGWRPD